MNKKIIVGRFGSTFGIRGWIKVISFTEPLHNILDYPHWYISSGQDWEEIILEQRQAQSKNPIVKISGCDTPEQARLYTNLDIAITQDQLPSLANNEYYWSDLEGLAVTTTHGRSLGTVDHLLATGANDVLVVKGDKERLIPYIKAVIKKVDTATKTIIVDWDPEF